MTMDVKVDHSDCEPLLVSVKEAARRLDISQVTIYQLAKSGHIKLIKFGARCTRVPVEDIVRISKEGVGRVGG